jgi:glucose/arabinose dehydrogenase
VQLQIPEQLRKRGFTVSHTLNLPAGFSASLYALLDEGVRFMTLSPDGVVFVSEMGSGQVVLLKDNNGVAERVSFADGLDAPHGLAFHISNGITYLYVAEMTRVVRFAYQPGQQRADKKETIVTGIPGGGNHRTRTVVFGKDGKMYLSVGSSCNVCEESDQRRGSVLQFNDDGTNGRIFSTGLRNGVGLVVNPFTGELWETENGRDSLGDNIPPEEINILTDGGNYGWPYCYSNGVWDGNFGKRDQAFCNTTIKPALPMQAHSAPLGIDIYTGKQFPADYVGDAFVGFHGSWNRNEKTGYKVVRLRVKDGRPVSYEDFATGWLVNAEVWGRPVMPMMAADGSLLVSDDMANAVYRITYTGR